MANDGEVASPPRSGRPLARLLSVINGVHAIVFSSQAGQLREFFAEVLGLDSVDAGGGWPISPCRPPNWPFTPAAGTPAMSCT
jgi:hypothetical protein